MKKFKIGLIGSSCSGKTTMATKLIYELRKLGYLCEGVIGSDRNYTFDPVLLDTSHEAQQYVILQQALLEVQKMLRKDVEILITDRSLIDFFAYYEYCVKRHSLAQRDIKEAIGQLAHMWVWSYDLIFYLEPLPYKSDNLRPSDEFRKNVDKVLQSLIRLHPTIIKVKGKPESREKRILNEVLEYVKKKRE